MAMEDLTGVREAVLVRPGDTLVIALDDLVDDQRLDRLRNDIKAAFGDSIHVAVVERASLHLFHEEEAS